MIRSRSSLVTFGVLTLLFTYIWAIPSRAQPPAFGTYQLVIVPVVTQNGTPQVTVEDTNKIVANLSQGYVATSKGKINFSLKTITPPIRTSGAITDVRDFSALYLAQGMNIKADPGFAGVLFIGVMPHDANVTFAGEGDMPGQYVLINWTWDPAVIGVLAHEIGHNLGLGHSGLFICDDLTTLSNCRWSEYGDNTDIMGDYWLDDARQFGAPTPTPLRFSAYDLDLLGLLDPNQRTTVLSTNDFLIAPVYSDPAGKVKILYIPIQNSNYFEIEYRPATGIDSALAIPKLIWGLGMGNSQNIQSGVQIRRIALGAGLAPSASAWQFPNSALLTGATSKAVGLQAGDSMKLYGGTSIEILSEDTINGALVRVTQTPDIIPPTVKSVSLTMPNADGSTSLNPVTQIHRSSATEYNWLPITASVTGMSDDRGIASASLYVNGNLVDSKSQLIGQQSADLAYTPKAFGTYDAKVVVEDGAGNKWTSAVSHFETTAYVLPKPTISIDSGLDPYTSIDIEVDATESNETFSISGLSAGHMTAQIGPNYVTYSITQLPYGSKFKATLEGRNAFGESDGGQIVTGSTQVPPTPSKPQISVSPGTDVRSTLEISIFTNEPNVVYELSNLSSGVIKSKVADSGQIAFLIAGLLRNTQFTATLTGTNQYGLSDGGSAISATTTTPACTDTVCYVGEVWKFNAPYFSTSKSVIQLQELILSKWKVTKTFKMVKGPAHISGYPYTFDTSTKFRAVGKHTLRLISLTPGFQNQTISKGFVLSILP